MATSCVSRVCPARQGLHLGDSGCIRNARSSHFACCVQTSSSRVKAKYREHDQGRDLISHANATNIQPAEPAIFRPASGESSWCVCPVCSRRSLLPLMGGLLFQGGAPAANAASRDEDQFKSILEEVHPARPDWYEEFFAQNMRDGMRSYEDKMAGYKRGLLSHLDETVHKILELGVGTGPNLKYYAGRENITVVGVDPNLHMEPYARASADAAGLTTSQFEFIHAVGEAIPMPDSSVDAVVCTLVLCSVKNVDRTLAEVQRVLKPGGTFLFIEHVAATESSLRFWQYLLNPLEQLFADGCNLTRETLDNIQHAGFESVDATRIMVPDLSIIAPHIVGTAQAPRLRTHGLQISGEYVQHYTEESYLNDKMSLTQLWKNSSLSMGERRRRSFASIGDTAKLEKETKEKERRLTETRAAVAAEREIFERLRKEAAAKGSWLKSGQKHVGEKEVPNKQPKNFKPQSTISMFKSRNYSPLIPLSPKILSSENKQLGAIPKHSNPTQSHRTRESGYELMTMDVEAIQKNSNPTQIHQIRESGYEFMDIDGDILHIAQSKQRPSVLENVDVYKLACANPITLETPKDSISSSSDHGFHALEPISKTNNFPSYDLLELISINKDSTLTSNIESTYEPKPKIERTCQGKPESDTNLMAMSSQSEKFHLQRLAIKPLSIGMANALKAREFDEAASHESFRQAVAAWRNANGGDTERTLSGSKKVFDTLGCQTESPSARQAEPELDPPLTQRSSYFYHLLFQFPNHAPFVKSMTQMEEEKRLMAS